MPAKKTITVPLDNEFLNKVRPGITGTWEVIAYDAIACCAEAGDRMTQAAAMETVLDANYMSTNGFKTEEDLITKAIDEHGYEKVEKFLRKNIALATSI